MSFKNDKELEWLANEILFEQQRVLLSDLGRNLTSKTKYLLVPSGTRIWRIPRYNPNWFFDPIVQYEEVRLISLFGYHVGYAVKMDTIVMWEVPDKDVSVIPDEEMVGKTRILLLSLCRNLTRKTKFQVVQKGITTWSIQVFQGGPLFEIRDGLAVEPTYRTVDVHLIPLLGYYIGYSNETDTIYMWDNTSPKDKQE